MKEWIPPSKREGRVVYFNGLGRLRMLIGHISLDPDEPQPGRHLGGMMRYRATRMVKLALKRLIYWFFKDKVIGHIYHDGVYVSPMISGRVDLETGTKAMTIATRGTEPPPPTVQRTVDPDLLPRR